MFLRSVLPLPSPRRELTLPAYCLASPLQLKTISWHARATRTRELGQGTPTTRLCSPTCHSSRCSKRALDSVPALVRHEREQRRPSAWLPAPLPQEVVRNKLLSCSQALTRSLLFLGTTLQRVSWLYSAPQHSDDSMAETGSAYRRSLPPHFPSSTISSSSSFQLNINLSPIFSPPPCLHRTNRTRSFIKRRRATSRRLTGSSMVKEDWEEPLSAVKSACNSRLSSSSVSTFSRAVLRLREISPRCVHRRFFTHFPP